MKIFHTRLDGEISNSTRPEGYLLKNKNFSTVIDHGIFKTKSVQRLFIRRTMVHIVINEIVNFKNGFHYRDHTQRENATANVGPGHNIYFRSHDKLRS